MVYTEAMNAATVSYEEVEDVTLQMARADRSRLASKLLESLDGDNGTDISPEWISELDRRVKAHEAGEMGSLSFEEVCQRLDNRRSALAT